MANASIEIEIKALDKATSKLDKIERSLNPLKGKVGKVEKAFNDVDRSIGKVEKSSGRLKGAFGALAGVAATVGLGAMAKDAIDTFTGYERLQVQLQTYLGSQEKANAEMARLQTLANSLPQDLADITGAFVTLTRVGVDTSNESITALSNVATANAKSFDQLAEALADSLTGEFERLKEFGIKVSKENDQFVADFGNGNKKVFNSAQEVTDAVIAMGMEGGRFGDAAKINADTLSQSFSNLKGAVYEAQVAFGEGAKGGMKAFTEALTVLVRDNKELITGLGEGLGNVLAALPDAFIAVKGVMEDLEPVFSLLSTIAKEIVIPLGKLAFETLIALAEAVGPLAEKWIPILKDAFVAIAGVISGTVTAAFEGIKATIEGVMSFIEGAYERAQMIFGFLKDTRAKAGEVLDIAGEKVGNAFDKGAELAGKAGDAIAETGGAIADSIGDGMSAAGDYVSNGVNNILGSLGYMDKEAVSNSIVPDMVDAIIGEFSRLSEAMSMTIKPGVDMTLQGFDTMSDYINGIIYQVSALNDTLTGGLAQSLSIVRGGLFETQMGVKELMSDMGQLSGASNITSSINGIGTSAGPVNSNVNFNISGINVNNDRVTPEMRKYVEGVAMKVANQVLRQNTNFGGLL